MGEVQGAKRFAAPGELQKSGYSGLVLERLVKHVCRVADVQRACIFVRDRSDPRVLIAAAAHGTSIDLLGSRIGADEGVLGRALSTGGALFVPECHALRTPGAPSLRDGATPAPLAAGHLDGA